MVDYIKIYVLGCNRQRLLNNPLLDFHRSVSEKTGLLDTKTIAVHHYSKITVNDKGAIIFSGSIHKMYNSIKGIEAPRPYGKGYNGNQFEWQPIDFILKYLVSLFNVEPQQMLIKQIEYGQNLITIFYPQSFLTGLLMHQGKQFEFRYNEYYAQCVHSNYIIKAYNKGNQYQMPNNVLRFEIKVLEMRFQKKDVGIATVADITPESLIKAYDFLIKQLEKVIYYDTTISKKNLSKVDKNRLQKYSNPNYWKNLSPNKRHEPKKILAYLIKENSQDLKGQLLEQLKKNGVRFRQLFENDNGVRFRTSSIGRNITLDPPYKCPITGLSLEHEKKGAKYALTTTLVQLKKDDEKKYTEVCAVLLSKSRCNQPKYETTKTQHLAKQIRNRVNNPRPFKQIGYKKKIMPQLTLF